MSLINALRDLLGPAHVLTGSDAERYREDWTGSYRSDPVAVIRPANTAEVSAALRLAHEARMPVVPVGGNTGLAGGTHGTGALMLSLERMNRIREIRSGARIAIVEAGVVLSRLHEAAEAEGLRFPVTFGARGSAMIGGILSTHAGGSNVVRYGSTRAMCLGLEVVMADGQIVDLMSELHKDNSGYDLRDLFIGAEGTLGIITGAVLKLAPAPRAQTTAMLAARDLPAALAVLTRLQDDTGGAVEAFEYMPRLYMETHARLMPEARRPFETTYDVNILVELGTTLASAATVQEDGTIPLATDLETCLAQFLETGEILDAVIARSETERTEMWARREAAAEISATHGPWSSLDVSVATDRVPQLLDDVAAKVEEIDPGAQILTVSHLGDGNVHYTVWLARAEAKDPITEAVEEIVVGLGGSFSAEHGIGLSKRPSMARRKNPAAIEVMRKIKAALDPENILNPGKVLP